MKKIMSYLLILSLVLTNVGLIHANEPSDEIEDLILSEVNDDFTGDMPDLILSEVEINEFNKYLNELKDNNIDSNVNLRQPRSIAAAESLSFLAGSFFIPGVGEVVITLGGIIIVAGVTVSAASAVGKKVTNWAFKCKFNKSAEDAVNNANQNKRNHIIVPKHNWNKFNKKPDWNNVGPLIVKTLKEGSEKSEGRNIFVRTLVHKGNTIQVRFIKNTKGLVQALSTAWVK